MKHSIVGTIVALFLLLNATLPVAAADITLGLARGTFITLPDWISYVARTREHGIQKSADGKVSEMADGLIMFGKALDGDAIVYVSVIEERTSVPDPKNSDFPIEQFGQRYERKALRDRPGGTIQRINLALSKKPEEGSVLDHEFAIVVAGRPEQSTHVHHVFLFIDGSVISLEIEYPMSMEAKWGDALKAISQSFKPAS
jgi:hypothetical protein